MAHELATPYSLAFALSLTAWTHVRRREEHAAHAHLEALMTLATEQGFQFWVAEGMILRGWTLAAQGQGEEGIAQMRQGLAASRALGVEMGRPSYLALLAEVYGNVGQAEEGLTVLSEAFAVVANTGGACLRGGAVSAQGGADNTG